jgi:hypothetical protein
MNIIMDSSRDSEAVIVEGSDAHLGLQTMCEAGGMANALIVEKL